MPSFSEHCSLWFDFFLPRSNSLWVINVFENQFSPFGFHLSLLLFSRENQSALSCCNKHARALKPLQWISIKTVHFQNWEMTAGGLSIRVLDGIIAKNFLVLTANKTASRAFVNHALRHCWKTSGRAQTLDSGITGIVMLSIWSAQSETFAYRRKQIEDKDICLKTCWCKNI